MGVKRADYMQGTSLKFKTEEDAVLFAEKQGEEKFSLLVLTRGGC